MSTNRVVRIAPGRDATWAALDPQADVLQPLEAAWTAARSAIAEIRAGGGGSLTLVIPAEVDASVARATIRGGVEMLVRALAVECGAGAAAVRVNAVVGDPARSVDVARLIDFVGADAASFVSGQVIATRG